jgi:hypothetical protein
VRPPASGAHPGDGRHERPAESLPGDPAVEHDTPAEVDAAFRTQRRIALGYFLVFLVVTLTVPLLALVLDWWSEGELLGSLSPNFVMVALGLYAFFFTIGLAAAGLATAVEERMLGGPEWSGDGDTEEPPG